MSSTGEFCDIARVQLANDRNVCPKVTAHAQLTWFLCDTEQVSHSITRVDPSVTGISPVADGTPHPDPAHSSIKRGVASMCRIDMPALPEKKKRK